MKFAEVLRKEIDFYENVVDKDIISRIKTKCIKLAKEGQHHLYTDIKMGNATKQALIDEGLKVVASLQGTYTYEIIW